jgi:NAD(P)-dependent dehydrogenase (short-subunit alcohol dehydrogenase family)
VPVQCDHENAKEVENLFKRIEIEQKGQLDLLVNSAYKGGKVDKTIVFIIKEHFLLSHLLKMIFDNSHLKFWETEPAQMWDDVNNVGLR